MRRIFRPPLGGEFDPHRRQKGKRMIERALTAGVPVPAVPAAHLVAVQPDLLLGRLEALLDRPAPIRPPGWWRLGRTRRNTPSRPAWRSCGAPAASGPTAPAAGGTAGTAPSRTGARPSPRRSGGASPPEVSLDPWLAPGSPPGRRPAPTAAP